MCHPQRSEWMLRDRETLLADWPLAAWAGRRQGSIQKAAQCHKGIALSLFVMIDVQERNIMTIKKNPF